MKRGLNERIDKLSPWEIWAHWQTSDSKSLVIYINLLFTYSEMGKESSISAVHVGLFYACQYNFECLSDIFYDKKSCDLRDDFMQLDFNGLACLFFSTRVKHLRELAIAHM